ncbi:hypothetical protein C882_4532 [Caenispirillum salinarum AK4]|uniref:Uncharacterized protein n=1 Tax=Caenispirillum salinarum AK4 TaxID=1238182 RepID=K9GY21_9PROT|nr:hypothetical protein [Caenispirillum salinarum]EKV30132.1 hypothetical protein C882_4532 [Caenispirillum salinarum AK4]
MSNDAGASDRAIRAQVLLSQKKSMGMALLLTLLFGPLGMIYATILGAIIMLVVTLAVGTFTLGFGLLITWPVCLIWTAMSVAGRNKSIDRRALAA